MKIKIYTIIVTMLLIGLSIYVYTNRHDQIKTELYFGLSNNKGVISPQQWEAFRKDRIENLLNGFTEIKGNGYWKSNNGKALSENSVIIIYIHDDIESETQKIDSLISLYKKEFNQESVLKTDQEVNVQF